MRYYLPFFLFFFCCSSVQAQSLDYRLDSLSLQEDVSAALAQWQAVEGGNVNAEASETATTVFALGDGTLLGPDVLSLTLLERNDQGEQSTRILLAAAGEARRQAVLHEWGRLLDLPIRANGVMYPVIDADNLRTTLSSSDQRALRDAQRYVDEDVNRDGQVDFYDLLELAANYNREGARLAGDLNDDGIVNQADVAMLQAAYQFLPPSQTPPVRASDDIGVADDAFPDLTPDGVIPDSFPSDTTDTPDTEGALEETPPPAEDAKPEEAEATEGAEPTGEGTPDNAG